MRIRLFGLWLIGLLALLPMAGFPAETRLLRYPDIQGNSIAFCYGGDLYVASATGRNVKRLTAFPGEELLPKFSPDGKRIAFTAEFEGNKDVYVMPAEGGPVQLLTYHPADEYVVGWHPDGKSILFRSNGSSSSYRFNRLHTVPAQGGLPTVLALSEADVACYNDAGNALAFCRINDDGHWRKGYRGGGVPDIWTYDLSSRRAEPAIADPSSNRFPMWIGERIYFISDRGDDKTQNLYAFDRKSRAIRQVTFFKGWDVSWPSRGSDQIIFENEGQLKVYDPKTESLRTVVVEVPQEASRFVPRARNVKAYMRGAPALSPDGKTLLVSARGDLFRLDPEKASVSNLTRTAGVNERYPVWSPDGRLYAYISDVSGEEQIFVQQTDGGGRPTQVSACVESRLGMLTWSPDGQMIGYADQRASYYVLDIQSKKTLKVIFNAKILPSEMVSAAWSPDSRWLAYSSMDPDQFHTIYLYSLDRQAAYRVTDGLTDDVEPQFDPGGRYLYWISNGRRINIGTDFYLEQGHVVDPSMIMAATLDKKAPAPLSKEEETPAGPAADVPKSIRVDIDGLGRRITALPVQASTYSDLRALKGRLIYRSEPAGEEPSSRLFDLATGKETTLPKKAGSLSPAARADKIAYRSGDRLGIWTIQPDGDVAETPLDLSGLTMTIDLRQEWRQIFHEAWRIERDLFYDETMLGVDWPAMERKYERFLPAVASRPDLNDLIGMMFSEIRHSETGIEGGDMEEIPETGHGLLGIDLETDQASRLYKIAKIYRGQNWDPQRTSPLTLPGMNIEAGDFLLAIDGTPLGEGLNPDALLLDKAGVAVTLTINDKPGWTGARKVQVRPAAFSREEGDFLRYNDWVLSNLEKVDKASEGKIGYIPVPDTYLPGIESFLRYYMTQFHKQALIIDIRYNSGGYSPYWMLESLNRQIVFSGRLPFGKAPMIDPVPGSFGPKACLVNEWAASGGDMFAHMFRKLRCGLLVGKRSSGSLAGAGGGWLVDGGLVRVAIKGFDKRKDEPTIENSGVSPDIEVTNRPDEGITGKDAQLERAIEVIMEQLTGKAKKMA